MNPNVRYIENKKLKKRLTGANLWAVKPVRKSVTLNPWGMYAVGKKEQINEPRGRRLVACKARTGSSTGDPCGLVQLSKKRRGQAGTVG